MTILKKKKIQKIKIKNCAQIADTNYEPPELNEIIFGDCLEVMKTIPSNYVSCIVTDPPYGLGFMGKDWDAGVPHEEIWKEALRIVKPGGHILAFGGSRTYHRLTCAIEDAGWEIRDCIMWLYGSGFPKSHDISKALDKKNDLYIPGEVSPNSRKSGSSPSGCYGEGVQLKRLSNPQSEGAKVFSGYGTALKPAHEPIVMAMKPLDGTFAQNAEKWGLAGINIDGCRVPTTDSYSYPTGLKGNGFHGGVGREPDQSRLNCVESNPKGRWPANVIFDEEAGKVLDEQSGISKSRPDFRNQEEKPNTIYQGGFKRRPNFVNDSGGASRFFYCAKASPIERNEGIENLPVKNHHPTVKPLKLMEYLIKLVMPPKDGILLDPFAGSGTTILAAKRLGVNAIGIEKCEEYSKIARARIG